MKNKTTAALIALLLGGFGIHRFYLGQSGIGAAYLIFSLTFIPAIIAFIDGIIFLTMDEEKFNEKYNQGIVSVSTVGATPAEELEKFHLLKEKGAITEEEFQVQKEKLL